MLEWQKWFRKDSVYANEYREWIETGCLGPEPQWSQDMACDGGGIDTEVPNSDDGPGENMHAQHGNHQRPSQQEPGEWNPFADPASGPSGQSGASYGTEMQQIEGAPFMQPLAKAKGKKTAYGSVAGKSLTARIEPYDQYDQYDSSVDAILAAREYIVSGCLDALQQYKETVAATSGPKPSCG